jgi:2-iminobutanoate/2-iminopropanoate deaminase
MNRKIISSDDAPASIGPYSQGVAWEDILFTAGQIPLDPKTGKLVEGDIPEQVMRIIKNLRAILEAGGSSLSRIIRLDVFLTDLSLFPEVNDCLTKVFTASPPARITVEVAGLPMGAQIEMAAIAGIRGKIKGKR